MRTPGINWDDGFRYLPPRDTPSSAGDKFNIANLTPPKGGWKGIQITQQGSALNVLVTGGSSVDLKDAKRELVESEINYLVENINSPIVLRFEMSNLTYLSSKAWEMLVNATEKLTDRGATFELVNITPEMYEPLVLQETKYLLNKLNIINPPTL